MRKVFHFFRQNAKCVSLFSTKCEMLLVSIKCEKCFNFCYKMLKVCESFLQDANSLENFSLVYNFFSVFPNMCAKKCSNFLTYVRVRSTKLNSNCFSMVYFEPLIYSDN